MRVSLGGSADTVEDLQFHGRLEGSYKAGYKWLFAPPFQVSKAPCRNLGSIGLSITILRIVLLSIFGNIEGFGGVAGGKWLVSFI